MIIDPAEIAALQSALTAAWHEESPAASGDGFLRLVRENHLRNFQLWHEEDIARRDDLGSPRVHQAKRAIDRFNQERNNFIEEMDKALVAELQPAESGCPKNSETPGMIIDRLSILALKEFHMREQAERGDASVEHRANCGEKLARIRLQRGDLTRSLAELIDAVRSGTRSFAVYYQFKMYNDPALNPQLYAGTKPQG
ncbi:MAG: DUF4254 domain-containing protein [Luteolibacter sp.]|jgi:hypothetical protein|nr:DUF4254 domain-containing protein [Luteolibacter sp.]